METPAPHSPSATDTGQRQYALAALALVLVLLASVALRLYPTLTSPALDKMISSPVLIEHDSYLYLRYAKEYCAGTYEAGELDALRGAHNEIKRGPLPLLSAAACYAHKATGASMEHVAIFLPLVFSALICIPLWLFRGYIGGSLVSAVAIVFTLTSPIYIVRTKAGFFDTDCLIPFFMLMVLWFLQRAAETRRWRGVLYAALGGVVFRLFMLWYGKPILYYVFAAMLAALLMLHGSEGGLKSSWLKSSVLRLLAFLVIGFTYFIRSPIEWIQAYLSTNVLHSSTIAGSLPNVAATVSELAREPLRLSINRMHNEVLVIMAAAGLLWLFASKRRDAVWMAPLIGLGAMGLGGGARYLIYLVPVMGIGLGFLVIRGSEKMADALGPKLSGVRAARALAALPLIAGMGIGLAMAGLSPRGTHTYIPLFKQDQQEAFRFLRTQEPGIVWTWWDLGYAIQETSGQATYVDGGINVNAYYVAHSLVQSSNRDTYDVITNVLTAQAGAGVDKGAPRKRPVYLLFTGDMIDLYTWIQYFGNWDIPAGRGDKERQKRWRLGSVPAGALKGPIQLPDAKLNMADGTLVFQGQMLALHASHIVTDRAAAPPVVRKYPYGAESPFIIEVVRHESEAEVFLAEKDFYGSQFNRMFILGQYDPALFELIYDHSTGARVYRLR